MLLFHLLLESVLPELDHYLAIYTFTILPLNSQTQDDWGQVPMVQLYVLLFAYHHWNYSQSVTAKHSSSMCFKMLWVYASRSSFSSFTKLVLAYEIFVVFVYSLLVCPILLSPPDSGQYCNHNLLPWMTEHHMYCIIILIKTKQLLKPVKDKKLINLIIN
jgi:hypothetical protein